MDNYKGLQYHHTCPIIDSCIEDIKRNLQDYFYNNLNDSLNLTSEEIETLINTIYKECIDYSIEEIRGTNECMRETADEQINELKDTITDLEYKLENYEN